MTTTTDNRRPLQSTTANNIPKPGRTIEETYQKKSQLEHILLRPDTYIGSIENHKQKIYVWEDDTMVERDVNYVPGLYKIFDENKESASFTGYSTTGLDGDSQVETSPYLKCSIDGSEKLGCFAW